MDAISYLVSRKSKSPYLLSAVLLALCVVSKVNSLFLPWLESEFPTLVNNGLLVFFYGLAVILTGIACLAVVATVFLGLPLTAASSTITTLRSWSENRVLEELTSTGLTHKGVFDQLLTHHLKRWFIIGAPSILFGYLCIPTTTRPVAATLILCLLLTFALALAAICVSCWRISAGQRGSIFLLVPLALIAIPSFLLFVGLSGAQEILGLRPATDIWLVAIPSVYILFFSRYSAIQALRSGSRIQDVDFKFHRKFLSGEKDKSKLSENPVVARQEMFGQSFADLATRCVYFIGLLVTAQISINESDPISLHFFLLIAGMIAAWKAANLLSQSLTQEVESSTLETIRSTPMGSSTFLNGWLSIATRPLVKEMGILVLCSLPFVITSSHGVSPLLTGQFALAAVICMAAPYIGGLFGASIAGQCKPRQEVAGQLNGSIVLGSFLTVPQVALVMSVNDIVWGHLFFTLMLFGIAAWVLRAGAEKSLNRVFLPQK